MHNIDEYLSAKEFATLIGVHYHTVLRSIKSGKLSAFRVGAGKKSSFRIAKSEINRLSVMDLEQICRNIFNERSLK